MNYWGKGIAGTLLIAGAIGHVAFAEPETTVASVAMPMSVSSVDSKMPTMSAPTAPAGTVVSPLDEERARLSVDMDQACEKLEARLHDLKMEAMNAPKKRHKHLKKEISKMKDQKSSVDKMHRKIAKASSYDLDHTKQSWDKLKTNIDKELSSAQ